MLIFDMRKIGNRLYEIRKSKGMTQSSLAEKAGLSDRTYADIERGTTNMRAETLLKICDALKITPDEIFTEQQKDSDLLKNKIDEKLASCNEKELKTVLALIDVYLASIG